MTSKPVGTWRTGEGTLGADRTVTGDWTISGDITLSGGITGINASDIDDSTTETQDFITAAAGLIDTWEGMAFDKPDLYVVNDGGLQFEVEKTGGGGDLRFYIGNQIATLDCTTGSGTGGRARAALTAGADANNPVKNYVYVTASGATATLSTSTTLPTGSFAWIGQCVVPDATTWGTTGEYLIQRYTESMENDSRGLLSHEREKLRNIGAIYQSGCTPTLNITTNGGSADNVHVAVTSGVVYQLHRQSWPAFTTGPYYYGNGSSIYGQITDLNSALNLESGTAIGNNERFNLVIWGAINYSSGDCKLFVNLPNGTYLNDANASADRDNTADYSVPDVMRDTAFLIARVVMKYTAASSGTWTEIDTFSLVGTPLGVRAGGASSIASNEFSDGVFRIFDTDDDTKEIAFDAGSITTATTRTITMADAAVDLSDVNTALQSDGSVDELVASSSQSSSYSIDFDGESVVQVTLTGSPVALTATNVPATHCSKVKLHLAQGAGAAKTVTWTGIDYWIGGSEPTLSTTTGDIDVIDLWTLNGNVAGHHLGTLS